MAAKVPASHDGPAMSASFWQPGIGAWPGQNVMVLGNDGTGSPGGTFPEAALRSLGFMAAHDGMRVIGWPLPVQE
jgi:hypothetical protein